MSQERLKKLKSTVSDYVTYTTKNKKLPNKLELKKFDPTPGVRKHVLFKEAKK